MLLKQSGVDHSSKDLLELFITDEWIFHSASITHTSLVLFFAIAFRQNSGAVSLCCTNQAVAGSPASTSTPNSASAFCAAFGLNFPSRASLESVAPTIDSAFTSK